MKKRNRKDGIEGDRRGMFYEDVFRELNRAGVQYLVVGGIAVNLHGVPRVTQDLDLLVDMSSRNVLKLIRVLEALGYQPRPPVRGEDLADDKKRETWIREKGMRVFSLYHRNIPVQEVDILVDAPLTYHDAASRKVVKNARDLEIPLASIPDLITLKRPAGRKQDLSDIAMLRKILEMERQDG
jgi:hypothetical protein